MALITNTAEGGSDNTGVTTGNSGGASGTAWAEVAAGTGTITFQNAPVIKDTLAYEFIPGSASTCYVRWTSTAANTAVFRGYLRLTGHSTAGVYLVNVRNSTGSATFMGLGINSTGPGTLFVQNTNSTNIFTTTGTLALNTTYRIEFSLSNGNAATGAMVLKVFLGDSLTEEANLSTTLTGQNFGTGQFGHVRIGRPSAFGTQAALYWDDLAWSDGTVTLLGPSSANIPPVADAGPDIDSAVSANFNLVGTGSSDPDGTISSYLWTQVSGPSSPTINNAATATANVTPTVAGIYVFQLLVTDNGSATDTDTATAYVYTTSARPNATTSAGLWTDTGGAGSIHAALADESDSTYAASPDNPDNAPVVVQLPPMFPTGAVSFPLRIQLSTASPPGTVLVELLDGTNSDAVMGSEQFNPTTSWAVYTFTLTSGEATAWTNRRMPKLRFTADV